MSDDEQAMNSGHRARSRKGDTMKRIAARVAWVTMMAVLAVGWVVVVEKVWPTPANGEVTCSDYNPCQHPHASKTKSRQFRKGKLDHTSTKRLNQVLDRSSRRMLKRAYVRWRNDHYSSKSAYDTASAAGRVSTYQTPWDPNDWLRNFKRESVCAVSGAMGDWKGVRCGASWSHFAKVMQKIRASVEEAVHVTVKCSGAAVLGGVSKEGKAGIKKAFGASVKGGWGMAAFGGACLWNEYFDRFSPWN